MHYNIDEFDPAKSQVFVTCHKLYNVRSPKSFNQLLESMPRVKIDSMLTKQDKWHPSMSDNVYNHTKSVFVINGNHYEAKFVVLGDTSTQYKSRTHFYFDDDGNFSLMAIYEIIIKSLLDKHRNIIPDPIFDSIRSSVKQPATFCFVVNTKIPEVNGTAAKLLST